MNNDGKVVTSMSLGQTELSSIIIGDKSISKIILGTNPLYKGAILKMDLNGSGNLKEFRVLNFNGSVAEVMTNYAISNTQQYDYRNRPDYNSSALDEYLNTSWYKNFSSSIKSAIVDKTIKQDIWHYISKSQLGEGEDYCFKDNNYIYYMRHEYDSISLTRHCYAIGIKDLVNYFGATTSDTPSTTPLVNDDIASLFNLSSSYGYQDTYWTLSMSYDPGTGTVEDTGIFQVARQNNKIFKDIFGTDGFRENHKITGVFQIDLSVFTDWEVVQ